MDRYWKKSYKFEALKNGIKREWVSWRVTALGWRSWEEKQIDSRKELIIRAEVICHLVKLTFLHARSPYTDLYRHTIQLPSPLIHRGVPWPPLQTTLWGTQDAQDSIPCVLGKWLPWGPTTEPSFTLFSNSPLNPWGQHSSLSPHKMSPHVSLLLINMAAGFIISLKIWSPDSNILYCAEVTQVFHILLAY